jgi:hypothetical protein
MFHVKHFGKRKTMLGRSKSFLVGVCLLGWPLALTGAEGSFTWTMAPRSGKYLAVNLGAYSLGKYLGECQVNRPEILNEVKARLREGEYYRRRTRDQKNRGTLLTVFADLDYNLHIATYRDDTCPDCGGTGTRAAPFEKLSSHVSVQFACLKCKGTGVIKDNLTEKIFVISSEDFENREEGREIAKAKAYRNAPPEAERWVERLISKNPRERLEACRWLDQNYLREGMFFNDAMPMLKKARYFDSNEKKKVMVWQFWAGKDDPGLADHAYYRVYADGKSGKITGKGFYSGR